MITADVERATWQGCYDQSWRDLIVPAAFAHPAKMSRGLIVRIFDELLHRGWLRRGDLVCDPFGGIGTTAIEAASRDLRSVCVELEPKFVEFARENVELHRPIWEGLRRPFPVILQGDSRQLRWRLADAACIVSSPPYAEIASGAGGLNTLPPKQEGQQAGRSPVSASQDTDQRYGDSEGQLAKLPLGDVEAVISSPPYTADGLGHCKAHHASNDVGRRDVAHNAEKFSQSDLAGRDYGSSPGQLSTLATGAVDAVVSSPPYSTGDSASAQSISTRTDKSATWVKANCGSAATQGYGVTEGQLGVMPEGETFWKAARTIVGECYEVLKPGGVAVWVVKSFVRNGQIVDFPGDWARLCEWVGFEPVLEVHASLVTEVTHAGLFGDQVERRERKSFFRRLAEKKGSPRIDWETVWFVRKVPR